MRPLWGIAVVVPALVFALFLSPRGSGPAPGRGSVHPGIWIGGAAVALLPDSGRPWDGLLTMADSDCGRVDLSDQDSATNVCILAKALVFLRTGRPQYRADVVDAISQISYAPPYDGTALALGRELGTYVIAADLIDLRSYGPALDDRFRARLAVLRTTPTWGAASNLVDCHERRPNNWGAHCGATRAAIAAYLEDESELDRVALVLRGYLGDRSAYSGFAYGTDLTWQCDASRPVGVNGVGCARHGLSLDGVLPDDQRRAGAFATTSLLPKENYVWEALQGLVVQAAILHRRGYTPFEWEARALLRSVTWLYEMNGYPAEGDDTWIIPILNHHYGTSFPVTDSGRPGKNVGWTTWTHPTR